MNEQDLKKFWEDFSSAFVSSMSTSTSVASYSLATMMNLKESKKVLEVGCGGGINAELMDRFSNEMTEFTLCDLSPKMVELARSRLDKTLPNRKISYLEANAEKLPYEDRSFDRYIADYVLHLTPDPVKMAEEAYRVLDDGGIAGFIVWGRQENSNQFTILPQTIFEVTGKQEQGGRSNFHLQDKDKTSELILNVGFKKCLSWYSKTPTSVTNGKQFIEMLTKGPRVASVIGDMDKEVRENFLKKLEENANSVFERGDVIGHEALILVAYK